MPEQIIKTCTSCGSKSSGKYCSSCGQPFETTRLTFGVITHEVFHFFTHLDKGFPFTFRQLIFEPGHMQRTFVEGKRKQHQKPFSMFFITASFAALAIYWINFTLIKYFDAGSVAEGAFFNKYWVLLQICLFPFYTIITYLFFIKSKYNFVEICVLMLYQFSLLFLLLTAIHLTKLIFHHFETRYIELPLIIIYSTITNVNFFREMPKALVIIFSILSISLNFLLASAVQDILVQAFS